MPKQTKKIEKKEDTLSSKDLDKLLTLIEEMQKNLNYLNDKVARILDRMGLNIWKQNNLENQHLMN